MKKSNQIRQIRIIGGQWKSRRVRCADAPALRPSPDAVRETLFNWLPHDLRDKTCLDLFAGSGAFGFEAASRGASKVVMVESHPKAIDMLRVNREKLQAQDAVEIFAGPVQRFIRQHQPGGGFDILFLDPPFDSHVLRATCENLQARGVLNPRAMIYIESRRGSKKTTTPLPIPPNWHIIRENHCGMVQSTLIQT